MSGRFTNVTVMPSGVASGWFGSGDPLDTTRLVGVMSGRSAASRRADGVSIVIRYFDLGPNCHIEHRGGISEVGQ